MSGLFSKGPKTQTTTQVQTVPPYVQQAQETLLNFGSALAKPFISKPAAKNQVAPFTRDQLRAMTMSRNMAEQEFRNGTPAAPAAQATAAQLTGADIDGFMNPYTSEVIDATMANLGRARDESLAAARARAAAGGSFGGSRGAVMEGMIHRDFGDTFARTAADLRRSGFDTAANLGMGNAQMRQAANLLNPQLALQRARLVNDFTNDEQKRRLLAIQNFNGMGGLQQNLAQRTIDVPWAVLDRMRSITPGATGGTTTTTQPLNQPSPLQTALSLGVLGLGLL